MVAKGTLSALVAICSGVLFLSSAVAVDVIKGTVKDFESGSPIAQVTVKSGTFSAVSSATGAYQLVFGTIGTLSPGQARPHAQNIAWIPGKGVFSIAGNAGALSIAVQDVRGRIVARYVSGNSAAVSTFSIDHLPQGMYLVSIRSRSCNDVFTIFNLAGSGKAVYATNTAAIASGLTRSAAAEATTADHAVNFIPPDGHVPEVFTVPTGTPFTSNVNVKLIAGKRIFDGKTMTGWKPDGQSLFKVVPEDTSFKNFSGSGHIYYDSAYLNYRIIYQVRQPMSATHNPGFLIWGQNPLGGNMVGFQFQLPFEWTWEYGNHSVTMTVNDSAPQSIKNCGDRIKCQRPFDSMWCQCEVVVDTRKGLAFAAVARPVDTTATWIMTANSNSVKSYPACRFGLQIHDAGEGDEYKNMFVQPNPTIDTLLTTQPQMEIVTGGTGPVVDLTKKGKMEGRWVAMDNNSTNSYLYEFRGNSLAISVISDQQDTTLKDYGVFALDSSATPNKLDVQVINPAADNGKTIATLYNYKGALGSFILCDIVPNDPGKARPADLTDALQFYFQFGSEK